MLLAVMLGRGQGTEEARVLCLTLLMRLVSWVSVVKLLVTLWWYFHEVFG